MPERGVRTPGGQGWDAESAEDMGRGLPTLRGRRRGEPGRPIHAGLSMGAGTAARTLLAP